LIKIIKIARCFALPIFPFLPRTCVGASGKAVLASEKAPKYQNRPVSENSYINRKRRKWFRIAALVMEPFKFALAGKPPVAPDVNATLGGSPNA
jgi:hypothetical protein